MEITIDLISRSEISNIISFVSILFMVFSFYIFYKYARLISKYEQLKEMFLTLIKRD